MKYVLRRILYFIPSLIGVVLIIFVMTRVLPGDPARMYVGEQAPQEAVEQARVMLGLDKSYPEQFVDYVSDLLHGDLGYAWHTGHTVVDDFAQRFPATLELAIFAILIAVLIGIPLGVLSATRQNSPVDHFSRLLSMIGAAMPVFWLGLMLVVIFYFSLGWAAAPMGRISSALNPPTHITGLYVLDSILTGDMLALKSSLSQLILPAITLAMSSLAVIARMTRASMLETLGNDYIRTARAKGLSERVVTYKHALSNALIPILTVLGSQFGFLLGATVVTETIFAWPGLGSYVTDAIMNTDYAPIQGFALFSVLVYLIINLVLDLLYAVVDPRVRYD